MSNNKPIKTVADTYRGMNSVEQNSSLTETTFTASGEPPSRDMLSIAAHVSKLADDSKKDKTLHRLAHDIHSHIANSHRSGMYDGHHWADSRIGDKHHAIATKHAKNF